MKCFRVSIVFNIFGVFIEIGKECNAYIYYFKKKINYHAIILRFFFIQFFDLFVYLMGAVKPLKNIGTSGRPKDFK